MAEDLYKKEEQVGGAAVALCTSKLYVQVCTMQVAELTREWAAKWKDIQRIVEVCENSTLVSLEWLHCCLPSV